MRGAKDFKCHPECSICNSTDPRAAMREETDRSRERTRSIQEQAWDEGFLTGYQKAMGESTPNPYRKASR